MNYPAQQYPGYPAQPAPQQFVPPQQFQQPMAPAYPQQPYPQQFVPQAPPQPTQPLVQGTLDDFYNQPSSGGGPGISWKDKPLGTSYAGVVTRDVVQADVVQDTDFTTKQPKFYRDGRPQFVMKVPLKGQPSAEFPDGEFAFWVRGQARDELVRAMAEVGCSGAPKAGALIQVTLVERKPSRAGNPANIVRIQYVPPQGAAPAAPAQPEQPQQVQQGPVPGAPSPVPGAASHGPAPAVAAAQGDPYTSAIQAVTQAPLQYPQQANPVAQFAQQPAPPAPVPQAQQPAAPQPPADLSPEQQQLLAQLTGAQG